MSFLEGIRIQVVELALLAQLLVPVELARSATCMFIHCSKAWVTWLNKYVCA